jgi:hypothetical protein
LLILLNERIDVLAPDVIIFRIIRTASKTDSNGARQFQEIQNVLLISEAHYKPAPDNLMGFLILRQAIQETADPRLERFLDRLVEKWSEFNKTPLFHMGEGGNINDLKPESVRTYRRGQETRLTTQESWRTLL